MAIQKKLLKSPILFLLLISSSYLRYALIMYPSYLWSYLLTQEVFGRKFSYYNNYSFLNSGKAITKISKEEATNELASMESLLYLSIIIIEIVCILTVLIIFPIFSIVQKKKQDVLNLLVTFDIKVLNSLIRRCKDAGHFKILLAQHYGSSHLGSEGIFKQIDRPKTTVSIQSSMKQKFIISASFKSNATNCKSKKRQISQTNKLQKCSLSLSLVTFIVFLVISLYSFLNYFLTSDFFRSFQYHIEELSLIASTKSSMSIG